MKVRNLISLVAISLSIGLFAQTPFYKYRTLSLSTNGVPKNINSTKSAVIITVPDVEVNGIKEVGNWKDIAEKSHAGFRTMGIDALFYLSEYDLFSSNNSINYYTESFNFRGIKNLVFITYQDAAYELIVVPFSGKSDFIASNANGFQTINPSLNQALLSLGKEIKRAELELGNFLIPETPQYLSAVSIIETERFENYPGQIRRNKIVVERFSKLEKPEGLDEKAMRLIDKYNAEIEAKNIRLDTMMKKYPFEYLIVDNMSNVEMIRKRYQFVLRNVRGNNESLRIMLGFDIDKEKESYTSIIPIMPDQSAKKEISREALTTKFYIRNNIATTIYTGIWDSDPSWEVALQNFIDNAIQALEKRKR